MVEVIGVRFRAAGKIYFFAPGKLQIQRGDQVIVETARGVEFGNVVMGPKEIPDEEITQPLKTVIRVATDEDRRTEEKNRKKEKEAFNIFLHIQADVCPGVETYRRPCGQRVDLPS